MSEERQKRARDSQLSAMFDGELPAAECELLARRLTRDEALRAQWSRFSMIGAALRAERGVALHDRVAWRVQSTVAQEAHLRRWRRSMPPPPRTYRGRRSGQRTQGGFRRALDAFCATVAGASIAAGVAAMSIFWLRTQDPIRRRCSPATPVTESIVLQPEATSATVALSTRSAPPNRVSRMASPIVYVTPAPSSSASIAPPARLANYVVAHSEYSGPLSRRMALLGLVATDPSEVAASWTSRVSGRRPQEPQMRRDAP